MSENFFLQAVVESYPDGIVIVDNRGHVIAANQSARCICRYLAPEGLPDDRVPAQIWQICQALFQNQAELGDVSVIIDDRIHLQPIGCLRVRAQWLIPRETNPYIMVTLEDILQNARSKAIIERRKYGLTEREMEVRLLQLMECTYKTMAQQLHITVNTVKKHVKSIHLKLRISL